MENMVSILAAVISSRRVITFWYDYLHREVEPWCVWQVAHHHLLRGRQIGGPSRSGRLDAPKLWRLDSMTGLVVTAQVFVVPATYKRDDRRMWRIYAQL
mgnify:CR=1 FL=1